MSRSKHWLDVCFLYVDCPACGRVEVLWSESEIEGVLLDSVRSCGSCTRGIGERTCPCCNGARAHPIRHYRSILPWVRVPKGLLVQSLVRFLVVLSAIFDGVLARRIKVPKHGLVFRSLWHNYRLPLVRFEKVLLVVNLNQPASTIFIDLALVQSFALPIQLSDDALYAPLCPIRGVQSRVQTLRAQHVPIEHHKSLRPSAIAADGGYTFDTCKVAVAPVSQSKLLELSYDRLL